MDFVTGDDPLEKLPQTAQMRQDLQDPARRDALRLEYKQGLPSFYPDIREELQLTPEEEDRLFDLLAHFQMQHLDLFYAREPGEPSARMKRIQENERQREGALLSFLGAVRLETYRRYQLTLPERQFVAWFARWLNPADALKPEQKSQLMAVVKAEHERSQNQKHQQTLFRLRALRARPSARTLAELREANIRANEEGLQDLEADSQRLLEQVASFLTGSQFATLKQLESQKLDAQRRWVRDLRTEAGSTNLIVSEHGVIVSAREMEGPSTGRP